MSANSNYAEFLANFVECFKGSVEVNPFMRGHVACPEHCAFWWHAWGYERVSIDTVIFQKITPHHQCPQVLTNEYRDNRRLSMAEFEAHFSKFVAHISEILATDRFAKAPLA